MSILQVQAIISNNKPFEYFREGTWKNGYCDPVSKVLVAEANRIVITVITNVKAQYIENLMRAKP